MAVKDLGLLWGLSRTIITQCTFQGLLANQPKYKAGELVSFLVINFLVFYKKQPRHIENVPGFLLSMMHELPDN